MATNGNKIRLQIINHTILFFRFLILSIIAFFASSLGLRAAHLKGGYIEYRYLGPSPGSSTHSRFSITVYQYLDCNSTGGQIDPDVNVGVFHPNGTLKETLTIPRTGGDIIQKQSFRCIDNPPTVCFRLDSYSMEAELENSTAGYILSVQRCCRVPGIVNVFGSSNTGVTYTVQLPATNAGFVDNASPIFAQEDTALVCAGNGFNFPFKATDPDGDSLVYSFSAGKNTPSRDAKPNPPLSPPFPDVSYTGGFSPRQPMGSQVVINRSTGIISGIAPETPGDYIVAVTVEEYRDRRKIAESRKEIHITVGSCNIPRAILPTENINCKSFEVNFENQSASAGILSYNWDFGVEGITTDVSTLPNPSYTYPDTGVYKVKLVVNKDGICPDSTTAEVRVFPGFTPDFENTGVCIQLPYQFRDKSTTSYGSINSWHWDFGDLTTEDDTSRLQNPVYGYTRSGTYNIRLIVTSTKGCRDTIASKSVDVLEKPEIRLTTKDTLICLGDTLQLQALDPGNYTWTPATNILGANTPNPKVFPSATTTYKILLDNTGCTNTDSVRVRVTSFITVDAGPDTTICRTDGIMFETVSDGIKYTWQPASTLNDPSLKRPIATPMDSITYYTVFAELGLRCKAWDTIKITTAPYPLVSAGNDTTICFASPVFLAGTSNASTNIWSPAIWVENDRNLATTARPPATSPFVLTASNNSGCTKPVSDTVLVQVLPPVMIFAGNDTSLVVNQPLQLQGVSNATQFNWAPSTGIDNTSILNPTITISEGQASSLPEFLRYTVTATMPAGCTATDTITIRVFKTMPMIFVPSGFTPNSDGRNDIMRPILAGIRQIEYFRIFNRYGQKVFETRQHGVGWDGKLNGQPQPTGAYVYDCRAIDYTGKAVQSTGTFTLVR